MLYKLQKKVGFDNLVGPQISIEAEFSWQRKERYNPMVGHLEVTLISHTEIRKKPYSLLENGYKMVKKFG